MILHYLKIAFRNLIKYKTQSLVSIVGLAVGFTCFAFSVLWIRYEMTYDTFHEGADNIYMVRAHYTNWSGSISNKTISNSTPSPLAAYLQDKMPEIEAATSTSVQKVRLRVDKNEEEVVSATADSAFVNFFNIQLLKGTVNFMKKDNSEIAVTEEYSKKLFGTEEALGKNVEVGNRSYKIGAIVSGWSRHSNIPYNILLPARHSSQWNSQNEQLFIRIRENTDMTAFCKKMEAIRITDIEKDSEISELLLTPISALRYSEYADKADVVISFSYIFYFLLASGLVIVCSLFNYLTLYVSRLYMRGREMALRKVNGAGNRSLFAQLAVELLVVLCIALVVGLVMVEICMSPFLEFTQIEPESSYGEIVVYFLFVILLSFLFAQIPLYFFRRRTLQEAIKGRIVVRNPYLFRKLGIVVQLIVSIVFIFCTVLIMKQLHFLKNTDLGMERHNIGSVALWNGDIKQWTEKISALPMITKALPPRYFPMIPTGPMMFSEINNWDDLPKVADEPIMVGIMPASKEFFEFYGLQLIEGELLSEKSQQNEVVINESLKHQFGWRQAVGKTFHYEGSEQRYCVVGVVKDFSYRPPTGSNGYIAFQPYQAQEYLLNRACILFEFNEGSWNECREAIEAMHKEDSPNAYMRLFNEEEEYNKYLRSEDALMKLLSFVSLVCVVISVFGIFSLITLSCEQRRKEIAIRKVNGAQVCHIMQLFFKEYLLLLVVAAVIAFPIGYALMKQWIESYVRQTTINGWLYLSIFVVVALIILLCIGWRVWKASTQNPAEVIKNE
ncbi:ABC transporter permease [Bacteroides sp.]|uniref:ABC transporter permease n=1 Tax=Bacteroides sp. TaxID=29523 RepID=UPI00261B08A8|nr:ABC transporter permease [Bacteroides sp.]MDD3038579.1 ABC transporter permease [Bacteroides sp.]